MMLEPDKSLFDTWTLKRGATIKDFMHPGEYGPAFYAIMARPDVPAAEKLIWLALLHHLFFERQITDWFRPTRDEIISRSGLSKNRVMRGLRWLHEHRFIECLTRKGHKYWIRLALVEDWPPVDNRSYTNLRSSTAPVPTPGLVPRALRDPVSNLVPPIELGPSMGLIPPGEPVPTPGLVTSPDTGTGSGPDTGTGSGPDTGTGSGPDTGTGSGPDTGTGSGPDTGTGQNRGKTAAYPDPLERYGRASRARVKKQQKNLNNSKREKSKAAVGDSRNSLFEAKADVLRRIGIDEEVAIRLAAIPETTALDFALLAGNAPKDVRNRAGWVIKRIAAGQVGPQSPWGTKEVFEVINVGWIVELDGYRFDGPDVTVRHNQNGLGIFYKGQRVGDIGLKRLRELATGFVPVAAETAEE